MAESRAKHASAKSLKFATTKYKEHRNEDDHAIK